MLADRLRQAYGAHLATLPPDSNRAGWMRTRIFHLTSELGSMQARTTYGAALIRRWNQWALR